MATVNEKIRDGFLSHQINIIRLSTWVGNQIKGRIKPTEARTNSIIAAAVPKLSTQASRRNNAAFAKLEKEVSKARGQGFTAAGRWHDTQAKKLVQAQFAFVPGIINTVAPFEIVFSLPSASMQSIAAYAQLDGATLTQWHDGLKSADARRIIQTVRGGVAQGKTTNQIISAVRGVYKTTENGAETLARTTTNGLANQANKAFFAANEDVIDAEIYMATLDARTSAVCRGLDNKKFPVGKGPYPPLHPNCRSTRVPVVDGVGLIGDRPSVGGTNFRNEARKKVGPNRWKRMTTAQKGRASNAIRKTYGRKIFGSVPADTTYEQFMKRQPTKFQNEVLGTTKAKLWRKGELKFDQMFDSRTYKELSLDEIKKRYKVG